MNTKFSYLYRDAGNYKTFNEIIFPGIITLEQIEPFLKEQTFFIPSKVGLPDLQEEFFSVDDHIWHEIKAMELTEQPPTITTEAPFFLDNFRLAHKRIGMKVKYLRGRV